MNGIIPRIYVNTCIPLLTFYPLGYQIIILQWGQIIIQEKYMASFFMPKKHNTNIILIKICSDNISRFSVYKNRLFFQFALLHYHFSFENEEDKEKDRQIKGEKIHTQKYLSSILIPHLLLGWKKGKLKRTISYVNYGCMLFTLMYYCHISHTFWHWLADWHPFYSLFFT